MVCIRCVSSGKGATAGALLVHHASPKADHAFESSSNFEREAHTERSGMLAH